MDVSLPFITNHLVICSFMIVRLLQSLLPTTTSHSRSAAIATIDLPHFWRFQFENKSQAQQSDQTSKYLSQQLSVEEFHTTKDNHSPSDRNSNRSTLSEYYSMRRFGVQEGSSKSSSSSRNISVIIPWIAASSSMVAAAISGWSSYFVWILLLLGSSSHSSYGFGLGSRSSRTLRYRPSSSCSSATARILPAFALATTSSTNRMSSYSAVFANAFHPSALSSAAKDDGNSGDNGNDKDDTTTSKANDPSDASTCTANDETILLSGRPHPETDRLLLFHYESTTSTQDEAKRIAQSLASAESSPPGTFCVTATSQTNGRGTTGRKWMGAPGNVFVTIGIPVQTYMTTLLRERNIPLTLLPLKVGDLTASLIQNELNACGANDNARVTVKWPNDVLVDAKKISGTLIENASDWFLVGVGINIAHAPTVPTQGPDYGRPSVSLMEYCGRNSDGDEQEQNEKKARDIGVQLALELHRWVYEDSENNASSIVAGWKRWLDFDAELTMRNDYRETGPRRVVRLKDVLPDGRIRVANKDDGVEEVLVSDYFV